MHLEVLNEFLPLFVILWKIIYNQRIYNIIKDVINLEKLFSFKSLKISIYMISGMLVSVFIYSSNKILSILGFISLGLIVLYDSFKIYKSTGKIPWLEVLLDILWIIP